MRGVSNKTLIMVGGGLILLGLLAMAVTKDFKVGSFAFGMGIPPFIWGLFKFMQER